MESKRKFSSAFMIITTVCCLIGIVISLASTKSLFGMFSYYTTQSNIYVLIVYSILSIKLLTKKLKKNNTYYFFKGSCVSAILLTFFIFNVSTSSNNPVMNLGKNDISSIFVHFITPIMVTIDFLFFDKGGKLKFSYPFLWALVPLYYLTFVHIRTLFVGEFYSVGGSNKYVYFFLDPNILDLKTVFLFIVTIGIFFLLTSYTILLLDFIKNHIENNLKIQKKSFETKRSTSKC